MDPKAIETSYARWAPIYDRTFGAVTHTGRKRAVAAANAAPGDVLEVGVGTGLSLPFYGPSNRVVGIDFSAEMLTKAQARVAREGLSHVKGLIRMDARNLAFADNSFDWVMAMHILSVVPEPERVMHEIARVCRPGGHVAIVNHFSREHGMMARIEKLTSPLADLLGWHPDFPLSRILVDERLEVVQRETLPPLGMMTFLLFKKRA